MMNNMGGGDDLPDLGDVRVIYSTYYLNIKLIITHEKMTRKQTLN